MGLRFGFRIYANWIHWPRMLALRSLMLILLSPSKTLSFEDAPPAEDSTLPAFLEASEKLMAKLKRLSAKKVEGLMSVNSQHRCTDSRMGKQLAHPVYRS